MTNDYGPTADDLLHHAQKFLQLATLLKYDKDFEGKFSAASRMGDEEQVQSLLAPLGIKGATVMAEGVRNSPGVCEHCWTYQGKQHCMPICR